MLNPGGTLEEALAGAEARVDFAGCGAAKAVPLLQDLSELRFFGKL